MQRFIPKEFMFTRFHTFASAAYYAFIFLCYNAVIFDRCVMFMSKDQVVLTVSLHKNKVLRGAGSSLKDYFIRVS